MILVVDDSPVIRSLVVAALAHIHLDVCEADSGASALSVRPGTNRRRAA